MTLDKHTDRNISPLNNIDKSLIVLCIWIITYMGGNLRYILKKIKKITKYEPFFTLFGAGMILGTLFSDLIPHFLSHGKHENETEKIVKIVVAVASYLICRSLEYLFDENHSHLDTDTTESISLNEIEMSKYSYSIKQNNNLTKNNENEYLKGVIIMFSYSVHSFFEGFALVNTTLASDFGMLIHKFLESFTVALSLKTIKIPKIFFHTAILFYASLTPLGYVIASFINYKDIIFGGFPLLSTFQALAFGSYIFITFDEMIPFGLRSKSFKYQKIIVLFLGCSISMISNILTHSH